MLINTEDVAMSLNIRVDYKIHDYLEELSGYNPYEYPLPGVGVSSIYLINVSLHFNTSGTEDLC